MIQNLLPVKLVCIQVILNWETKSKAIGRLRWCPTSSSVCVPVTRTTAPDCTIRVSLVLRLQLRDEEEPASAYVSLDPE